MNMPIYCRESERVSKALSNCIQFLLVFHTSREDEESSINCTSFSGWSPWTPEEHCLSPIVGGRREEMLNWTRERRHWQTEDGIDDEVARAISVLVRTTRYAQEHRFNLTSHSTVAIRIIGNLHRYANPILSSFLNSMFEIVIALIIANYSECLWCRII